MKRKETSLEEMLETVDSDYEGDDDWVRNDARKVINLQKSNQTKFILIFKITCFKKLKTWYCNLSNMLILDNVYKDIIINLTQFEIQG